MRGTRRVRSKKIEEQELVADIQEYWRPKTWGECQEMLDASENHYCPFVSCRYHLYLDVTDNGSIIFNFPDLEPWEIPGCCSLEIASRDPDGQTLDAIGKFRNVTRERVRQIEAEAQRKLLQDNVSLRPLTCNTPKRITRSWGLEDDDNASWVVGLGPQVHRR